MGFLQEKGLSFDLEQVLGLEAGKLGIGTSGGSGTQASAFSPERQQQQQDFLSQLQQGFSLDGLESFISNLGTTGIDLLSQIVGNVIPQQLQAGQVDPTQFGVSATGVAPPTATAGTALAPQPVIPGAVQGVGAVQDPNLDFTTRAIEELFGEAGRGAEDIEAALQGTIRGATRQFQEGLTQAELAQAATGGAFGSGAREERFRLAEARENQITDATQELLQAQRTRAVQALTSAGDLGLRGAGLEQQAAIANLGAQVQTGIANLDTSTQAQIANMQTQLSTSLANLDVETRTAIQNNVAATQVGIAEARNSLDGQIANAGLTLDALQFNIQSEMDAGRINTQADLQAQLANQGVDIQLLLAQAENELRKQGIEFSALEAILGAEQASASLIAAIIGTPDLLADPSGAGGDPMATIVGAVLGGFFGPVGASIGSAVGGALFD